jgi:DNA primase
MAKQYVQFNTVKMQVSMEQVLAHYGLIDDRATRKGHELILPCLFHENDKTPSLKINTVKNVFHCFGCNAGGDVLAFVVRKEGIATGETDHDRREAALLLQEWFHLDGTQHAAAPRRRRGRAPSTPATGAGERQDQVTDNNQASQPARNETDAASAAATAEPVNPPLQFTFKHLDPDHLYLFERGLTQEAIAHFGLGYHRGKGMMDGRIVIPIHNERGELVAYAGRWPGDPPEGTPRYLFPPRFQKSLVLFNLHRATEHATDGLIVVEGFFTVFEMFQRNRKNVVAVMGSSVSEAQERLIVETVGPKGRVLLAFDPDDAGRKGMIDAAARLAPQVFVRTVELKD